MLTRREALTAAAVGAAALVTDVPAAWPRPRRSPACAAWITSASRCPTSPRHAPGSRTSSAARRRSASGRSATRRDVHAGPARGRPARRDPRDQHAALRHGLEHRALRVHSPGQDTRLAKNCDFSGHHLAFYVEDIDAAVAYMEAKGVRKLLGPFPVTDGPAAGQSINYFQAPVRHLRRADLVPARHGLRGHGEAQALERPRHRRDGDEPRHPRAARPRPRRHHRARHQARAAVARAEPRRRGAAALRPDLRPDRNAHDRPRRRRPARGDRGDQRRARPQRLQHRALPVLLARSGHALRRQLELLRPPHRALRRRHRPGRRQPRRSAAARGGCSARCRSPTAPPPASRSTTSARRSAPTSSSSPIRTAWPTRPPPTSSSGARRTSRSGTTTTDRSGRARALPSQGFVGCAPGHKGTESRACARRPLWCGTTATTNDRGVLR